MSEIHFQPRDGAIEADTGLAPVDALAQAQARYRALFEAIDDGFCIIEFVDGPRGPLSDYIHVEANSGYGRHTGISDIVGKSVYDVAPNEGAEWVALYGAVLRTGQPIRFERRFAEVGRHIEVSASRVEPASLRQVSVLFRDITGRKQAEAALQASEEMARDLAETLEQRVAEQTAHLVTTEEALRQSQKMEAVGQLTGGIAHDFNNLLTAISGSLEMMQARIRQGRTDDIDRYMTGAQSAARRAAALTHRLLAFSRRQTLDPQPTDVNRLVGEMQDLIQRTVGPAIGLEARPEAALWPTLVDANQLENALLNLCINARDAMPDGGQITIETRNQSVDEATARELSLPVGDYVTMCVTDTGMGMTPEVIAKAFEPFFTTKPIGVGTGLGLSMIYGFARQSGGQVRITSDPGSGTTVCLHLPRSSDAPAVEAPAAQGGVAPVSGAGRTVLVVDDETLVRMLLVDAVTEVGFAGLEAGDGAEALDILSSDATIDLLVTDIGLPGGMNGRQLADEARALRPGLKVLFVTGYAETAVQGDTDRLPPGMQIITKPFDIAALSIRIRDMIEG
nr:ATP-binding protein [Aureimonas altamirensis]